MPRAPRQPGSKRAGRQCVWGQKALVAAGWLTLAAAQPLVAQGPPEPAPLSSARPNLLVLTNVAQVLKLSPEQITNPQPVRLRAVVTCYDPGRLLFVQDETAGIYVYHTGKRLPLSPGQGVEVMGVTAQGHYSPIISSPSVELLTSAPRVQPQRVSLAQISLGGLDAQWVEVTGVVRRERVLDQRLLMELADAQYRLNVWLPQFEGYERQAWVGALVRVRGVVGVGVNARQEPESFQLFANTLADITTLQAPPADPFAGPACPIGELRTHLARRGLAGSVRVRGVVTLVADHTVFVQDSTGGVEVQTETPLADVRPGRMVDIAGFLGPLLEAPRLEDAVLLKLQTNAPVRATSAGPEELLQGLHEAELVEVEAQLLGLAETSSNRLTLALESGNCLLSARLELPPSQAAPPALSPGGQLRLTGISHLEGRAGPQPNLTLLLRSPADIAVIGLPLPRHRFGLQALAIAALLTSAGLVLALWFIQKQRRRTEHLLQLQVALQTEMRQGEEQLRRSTEERERMARDLHDDIIQSIYAVGLNLEDCRRVVSRAPEQVEARLVGVVEALNKTIRSVRGFIAGLEPKLLNGRELKTALKSLALTSGEGSTPFQIDVNPAAGNSLSSLQATQLLHIAKEAISNSLRHARSSTIAVSLQAVSGGVRLQIRDDGGGFTPAAPEHTGQGLRNMQARAREIGAELKIVSAPSQGCRIVVTVPVGNVHEPD